MKLVSGTATSIRWQQYDRIMSTNTRNGSTDMTAAHCTMRTMCISLLISTATGRSIQSAVTSLRLSFASEQVLSHIVASLLEEGTLLLAVIFLLLRMILQNTARTLWEDCNANIKCRMIVRISLQQSDPFSQLLAAANRTSRARL